MNAERREIMLLLFERGETPRFNLEDEINPSTSPEVIRSEPSSKRTRSESWEKV